MLSVTSKKETCKEVESGESYYFTPHLHFQSTRRKQCFQALMFKQGLGTEEPAGGDNNGRFSASENKRGCEPPKRSRNHKQ